MATVECAVPQRPQHLERARQNEKLAERFAKASNPTCIDWAITLLFYSALHLIDGFLAGKNFHPLNHYERGEEIENNGSLSEIHKDYETLQKMSENARYEIADYSKQDYEKALKRFSRIKQHVLVKMGSPR